MRMEKANARLYVMTWIGIEPSDNIIPHESEQTSIWSFNARSRCERLEKEEA
jgi:hypothetical protein